MGAIELRGKKKRKADRIDLGLYLMSLAAVRGRQYEHVEIAAWTDCDESAIRKIERRAVKKVRQAIQQIVVRSRANL